MRAKGLISCCGVPGIQGLYLFPSFNITIFCQNPHISKENTSGRKYRQTCMKRMSVFQGINVSFIITEKKVEEIWNYCGFHTNHATQTRYNRAQ